MLLGEKLFWTFCFCVKQKKPADVRQEQLMVKDTILNKKVDFHLKEIFRSCE